MTTLTLQDQQAVVDATAASMELSSNEVSFVTYSIALRKRSLRDESTDQVLSMDEFAADILMSAFALETVSTTMMISVLVSDSASAEQTYLALTGALNFAIDNSTTFNEYLHSAAASVGSTTMATAVANGVSDGLPVIVTPSSNDDNSSDDGFSPNTALLVGIIAGGVVGILILGVVMYCLIAKRPSTGLAGKGEDVEAHL